MTDPQDDFRHEPVLIRTKFNRPTLPHHVVHRPRLLDRLDAASNHRLTLVSAGPGFGKTTAIVQWLEDRAAPASWLCLDPFDKEPDRFSRYLVEALKPILPLPLDRTEALLRARTPPPWRYFIEVLASELSPPQEPSYLVLEDYHVLASEPIDDLLERLIDVFPRGLHLIISSRVDPPWPLGRWRAHGSMSEVRSRDLRFSLEETRSFFALRPDLDLDDRTVEELHQRTEGWITGLRLAEMSMMGAGHTQDRAKWLSGSDRNIADFLIEDVLTAQPPEVREFLGVAASFTRFCAPLCDHVLAGPGRSNGSREIIAHLESRNMFLVPLDEERHWYRFHHLFQEFLLQRLEDLVSPVVLDDLDVRAAAWHAEQGMVEEALRHWVACGDLDSATEMIGRHVDFAVRSDLSRRVLARWLAVFPPGAENSSLPLLVAHGCQCIIHWDLSGLARLLDLADPLSAAADGAFRANLEALRAFLLYWRGDVPAALECARRALADAPPVGGVTWSLATMYEASASSLLGRRNEGLRLLDEAIATGARHDFFAAEFIAVQGILHLYALELDAVRQRALDLTEAHEHSPVPEYWLGHGYYLLGVEAYERNRLEEAEDWFRRVEAFRYLVTSRLYQDAIIGLALVARARGDASGMTSHVAAARAWAVEIGDPTSLQIVGSLESRLFPGKDSSHGSNQPPDADHPSFWLEVPSVTWIERLISDGSPEAAGQALRAVESALERVRRHHNERQTVVLLVLRAMALDAGGRRGEALTDLAATLRQAQPHGLVRTFLDRGPRLKELLDEISSNDGHDAYRERLRGSFLEEGKHNPRVEDPDGEPRDLLSYRELEVLELLAERLTDKEIAARLSVTPGAIKKRTRGLYHKLDAKDRREAVARGLARGILKTGA